MKQIIVAYTRCLTISYHQKSLGIMSGILAAQDNDPPLEIQRLPSVIVFEVSMQNMQVHQFIESNYFVSHVEESSAKKFGNIFK